MFQQPYVKMIAMVAVTAFSGLAVMLWPNKNRPETSAPAPIVQTNSSADIKKPAPVEALDFADALQEHRILAELNSHGPHQLTLTAHNLGSQPLRLHIATGQLFSSTSTILAASRAHDLQIEPNARRTENLETVALTSADASAEDTFVAAATEMPRLQTFFAYLNEHPEVPPGAIQTAALALNENLPLSAFAKFNVADSASRMRLATQAFKADTCDIIAALLVLRDLGRDDQLLLTADAQLKIEAMIDPLAHALALRYYNIGDEWAYWKNELAHGAPATRHYALYGIARFYPDIALEMLPKWARSTQTGSVFRLSAIQALAETQRIQALPLLRELQTEFTTGSDLGKTAEIAANSLDAQFTKTSGQKTTIAFRAEAHGLAGDKPGLAAAN